MTENSGSHSQPDPSELDSTLRGSPVTVLEQDRDLRIRWVANGAEPPSSYAGKRDRDFLDRPEEAERLEALKRRVLEDGEPARHRFACWIQARRVELALFVAPVRSGGEVIGVRTTAIDLGRLDVDAPSASSPAEAPSQEQRRAAFDLSEVASRAVATVKPLCRRRGQTISLALPARPLPLGGDPAELTEAIIHLLSVASRRSQAGAPITLTIERDGPEVTLSTGDRSFALTLPLRQPARAPARRSPGGRRILVVDDHADLAETLSMFLERRGHEVRALYSGEAALGAAPAFQPDVAIIDIGLPGMSGYELADLLQAALADAPPVLVSLTGAGDEETMRAAGDHGFDHRLVKPVDLSRLAEVVEAAADRVSAPAGASPCRR